MQTLEDVKTTWDGNIERASDWGAIQLAHSAAVDYTGIHRITRCPGS